MAMRAALYLRQSKDSAGDRLGVTRQEEDCRELAERRGWEVVEVFTDNDVSAYRGRYRADYERMLTLATAGAFEVIVAWHPDRLHRQPIELERFIEVLDRADVQVATVRAGDIDLSTAAGRLTARIAGAVARNESEHRSDRVRRAQRQQVERGAHIGRAPYGYRLAGKGLLEVVESEAAVVREIAARLRAGESVGRIRKDFAERGVTTRDGAAWTTRYLWHVVTNPRSAGFAVYSGEVIGPAPWPAIVDEDDRATLERWRDEATNRTPKMPARISLLSGGLSVCGVCKSGLRSWKNKGRPSYACVRCHKTVCRADLLEDHVVEAVLRRIDSGKSPKVNADPRDLDELTNVKRQLTDLAETYGRGGITHAEWMRARSTAAGRYRLLSERADRPRASAIAPETTREGWPDLTLDKRRAVILRHVSRVTVNRIPEGEHRGIWNPKRVRIRWR
jgi:DNA invertase Pin-like site-specific DNA recombinase